MVSLVFSLVTNKESNHFMHTNLTDAMDSHQRYLHSDVNTPEPASSVGVTLVWKSFHKGLNFSAGFIFQYISSVTHASNEVQVYRVSMKALGVSAPNPATKCI